MSNFISLLRPSTLLRVAEDSILNAGSATKRLVRRTKNELTARQLAAAQRSVLAAEARMQGMSAAERKAFAREQKEISARAAELLAAKKPSTAQLKKTAIKRAVR